jgi:hypothetical protein
MDEWTEAAKQRLEVVRLRARELGKRLDQLRTEDAVEPEQERELAERRSG